MHNDNRAEFKTFIAESCPGICSLLCNELSSCTLPLSDLLHIASYIQPRYYTISSSSSIFPSSVHITVSLTEFHVKKTEDASKTLFTGLASGFFKRLVPAEVHDDDEQEIRGAAVTAVSDKKKGSSTRQSSFKKTIPGTLSSCRVFVRASTFRLPTSLDTPIIMCGPGTGLAPMRALLQERRFLASKVSAKARKLMQNTLYFGCKNSTVDYIYRDELQEFVDDKTLTHFHTAFSRDGKEKVYVQHLLAQSDNAISLVRQLCDEEAFFFVCGATAMGTDVHAAITQLLVDHKGMELTAAVAFIKELQEKGRYVQELWSA